MRLDLYLKKVRIFKKRNLAKLACERKMVSLNGKEAKPSSKVEEGDRIKVSLPLWEIEGTVLAIPVGNVKKDDVPQFFMIEKEIRISDADKESLPDFWERLWEEVE